MTEKPKITNAIHLKEIAITTCFLTAFLSCTAESADADLAEANKDIQAIYKRIQEKYAEQDAQQAKQAASPNTQTSPNTASHKIDAPANEIAASQLDSVKNSATNESQAPSLEANESRFAAGEELILSTSVNQLELASIFATKTQHGLQIGLGDFTQIIEFPIYVDLDTASAEGWFLNEKNRFSLKKLGDGRLEVLANNKTYYVDANNYHLDGDLYVEMDDLERWFDLKFQINEERLALNIKSKNKLPVEVRYARLNKRNIRTEPGSKSVLPLKESDYRVFTPPMLDIQTSAQETKWVYAPLPSDPDGPARTSRSTTANYSILANHDLAYLNTELFLSGNRDDSLNSARLTMSRQSDSADLLGPLHATEYSFGDVVPVNASFGNTQGLSRGFNLGNTPFNQLADNRKVNITGPIQEGWDVELYRNGVLIDQRLQLTDGRYEFNDVALDYGNNDFELMLYGPQGQIETKTESYIVDSNTVGVGESMYRFSLVELGKSVFDTVQYTDDPTQQGIVASAVVDYGITDWLALNTGVSTFEPELGDTQQFYTLGANASLGQAGLLSARFLQDQNDLKSMDLNYRTRLFNTSYNFNAQRTEILEPTLDETTYTDRYSAGMSGRLFSSSWLPINYQNNWQLNENSDHSKSETFQNALGIGSRIGFFSNSLIWRKDPAINELISPDIAVGDESVTGALQYRKSFGRLHTRLYSSYTVKPTSEITSYGSAFNYSWSSNLNSELRYSYLTFSDKYQVNLGLNWNKDAFYLNTNAGYNEDGSWSAGIALRFSLGYEPMERSVFTSGRPIAQSGAVAVRVFEDLNMNGAFDENERPIENATVKAVQSYRQEKTNANGVAVLSSLYNNTTTDIVVDESTLDGPFMITANAGVAIKARKGFVDKVDLPVVKAGELDGIVYLKDKDGVSNPAPYVMLNLIDANGKIVATTRSEFDGYYLFTNVKPGNYQVKVDENYVDRRGLKTNDKNVGFSSKGDVIAGVDFVLRPLDEAKGWVASAGHFETPTMLKLYYHILRKKLGGYFVQTPFYIKQPNNGGYILGLAYYEGASTPGTEAQRNTEEACAALVKLDMTCEVQYHDFKY